MYAPTRPRCRPEDLDSDRLDSALFFQVRKAHINPVEGILIGLSHMV